MTFPLLYIAVGLFAGFLAGLLGVGGGLVIVPVLAFIFAAQHFPEAHILHFALGTSLASIIFTSVFSVRAHHAHGAVNWGVMRTITPGIVTGTLLGTWLAAGLSTVFLKIFFVLFVFYAGTQMLLNIKPKPARQLPGLAGMFAVGNVIGGVSALVGIGGGTLSVPFMTWCNIKMHEAIGTSAAIGFSHRPLGCNRLCGKWLGDKRFATIQPGIYLSTSTHACGSGQHSDGAARRETGAPLARG